MFSFMAMESKRVRCTPISFIGRLPTTVTSGIRSTLLVMLTEFLLGGKQKGQAYPHEQ